jgi:hypothetical protein
MKKIKLIFALLFCAISFAQVGVNTTSPTNTLDVNGGARIRTLNEGTIESDATGNVFSIPYKVYAFAVIDKPGTILKQYNIASVTKTNNKYRITFSVPMPDNDYIILSMAKNRNISYDTVTPFYFEVTVDTTNNQFDFNILIIDLI